ncbi:MAG: FAD:protein FMN transferase [Clostridiaceae bacterium]
MLYYIIAAIAAIILVLFLKDKAVNKTTDVKKQPKTNEIEDEAVLKEIISDEVYVLGTVIQLRAIGEKSKEAIEQSIIRLFQIDDKMSVFKEDSEVSAINKNAGISPSKISEDSYFVIKKAVEYANLSHGAFEPTIRPLVKLYGFGSKNPRIPSSEEINEALNLVSYKDVILDDENKSVMLKKKGQSLDLGAIAKGYAADEVKRIFEKNDVKSGMINLGGNIYAHGKKQDNSLWNVGIQDPLGNTGQYIGVISVCDKSVVTSGNYERYFEVDGKRYHHIINPKTGYPCENKIISTTIVSDHSVDGDGLTTCGYIMGLESGFDLIENTQGVDAIFITSDKKVYITSGIRNKVNLINKDYVFEERM